MSDFTIRRSAVADRPAIFELYRTVAAVEGGLIRVQEEVTPDYVQHFHAKSLADGLSLVAVHAASGQLAAEIHTYRAGIRAIAHVLGDLTIAVHPAFQGKGLGKLLFGKLLKEVEENFPGILRVELLARESNQRALALYEQLGFRREGRLENRIRGVDGKLEADVMMAWGRGNR